MDEYHHWDRRADTTLDGDAAADADLEDCPSGLTPLGWGLIGVGVLLLLLLALIAMYRNQAHDPNGVAGFGRYLKRLVLGPNSVPANKDLPPPVSATSTRALRDRERQRQRARQTEGSLADEKSAWFAGGTHASPRRNASYDTASTPGTPAPPYGSPSSPYGGTRAYAHPSPSSAAYGPSRSAWSESQRTYRSM